MTRRVPLPRRWLMRAGEVAHPASTSESAKTPAASSVFTPSGRPEASAAAG